MAHIIPEGWQALEDFMSFYQPEAPWQFGEVVLDEGQDFQPAWRDAMLKLLLPNGRAWWLEDPMQNLIGQSDSVETPTLPAPGLARVPFIRGIQGASAGAPTHHPCTRHRRAAGPRN